MARPLPLLLLLACACVSLAVSTVSAMPPLPPSGASSSVFAASFFSEASREWLTSAFQGTAFPCPLQRSDENVLGTSFVVSPPSFLPPGSASLQWGQRQTLQLMAFVRDERVQSVLVAQIINSPSPQSILLSARAYPAITMSAARNDLWEDVDPDAYAEALWGRLVDGGYLSIERDTVETDFAGRIKKVRLNQQKRAAPAWSSAPNAAITDEEVTTLTTTLPATLLHPSTAVQVTVLTGESPLNWIGATLCGTSSYANDTCTPLPFLAPAQPLAGFFPELSREVMRNHLLQDTCTKGWDVQPLGELTVIDPTPSSADEYDASLNQAQSYAPLAYARDEHSSSVLLQLTAPSNAKAVYARSLYPHAGVTSMSLEEGSLYDASYGEVLWGRLVDSDLLVLVRDNAGHILGASLPSSYFANETDLIATLGEYTHPTTGVNYPPTNVYLRLLFPADAPILDAVVCLSDRWDGRTGECARDPPGPDSSSSSSSSSTGGGGDDDAASDDDDNTAKRNLVIGLSAGGGTLCIGLIVLAICWRRKHKARETAILDDAMSANAYVPLDL